MLVEYRVSFSIIVPIFLAKLAVSNFQAFFHMPLYYLRKFQLDGPSPLLHVSFTFTNHASLYPFLTLYRPIKSWIHCTMSAILLVRGIYLISFASFTLKRYAISCSFHLLGLSIPVLWLLYNLQALNFATKNSHYSWAKDLPIY